MWYKSYTGLRFHFDERKSRKLRNDPGRGVGFEEAIEIFEHDYSLAYRTENPEQFSATGWVKEKMYSVVFEVREDQTGEYYHLVTLWKATSEERSLYGQDGD